MDRRSAWGGEGRRAKLAPLRVKLGYGGAEGSLTLVWTMLHAYFKVFLADVVGLSPATAAAIPGAFAVFPILLTWRCPMTREGHEDLRERIRLGKEGKKCREAATG